MFSVEFSDETVGSVTWELPENLASKLNALPEESQEAVRSMIECEIKGFLSLLLGAMESGPKAERSLDLIRTNRKNMARRLLQTLEAP